MFGILAIDPSFRISVVIVACCPRCRPQPCRLHQASSSSSSSSYVPLSLVKNTVLWRQRCLLRSTAHRGSFREEQQTAEAGKGRKEDRYQLRRAVPPLVDGTAAVITARTVRHLDESAIRP